MEHADVIVIGGGHAGCEAASAAARRGAAVAMIAMNIDTIGAMSCNPAIGGIGKGHIVREVDAFDGIMAVAADRAAIHYRMLNVRKGRAVQGPRVQADRHMYKRAVRAGLGSLSRLMLIEGEITALLVSGSSMTGVELHDGRRVLAPSVVIATGTFLGGRMFVGQHRASGGRWRERAADRLGEQLKAIGLPTGRMKTGTPPRLDGRTIDWSALDIQATDASGWTMSPIGARSAPQLFCAATRTNPDTHDLIRRGLNESPLRDGSINGRGPRYCPSIEDKIERFHDRAGHQIFLEPEEAGSALVYPNGLSTSLSEDVQLAVVRSIHGLERAQIVVPGYAIEYTHIDPRVLDARLAVRGFAGLFLAGQVNGTTGYEEAAGQGLVAGLNAVGHALGKPDVILPRDNSYIGVMIDDLIIQGVTEPYRMLTARSEHRLHLRADNAEARLTDQAVAADCLSSPARFSHLENRATAMVKIDELLSRVPVQLSSSDALAMQPSLAGFALSLVEEALEDRRYAPYLERQRAEAMRIDASDRPLPENIDYRVIRGLSAEMITRLEQARPATLEQARRLRGITPAAVSALAVEQARLRRSANVPREA